MNICWFGFLGKNHSWSIVAQNIARQLINMGHKVDLFSTNGTEHFPSDLKPYLKGYIEENTQITTSNFEKVIGKKLDSAYDMQISYTALKNFPHYFGRGDKNRFGIWNYETTILPKTFARCHTSVDKVLPSSAFSKKIFIDNGIPDDKQVVVPHGIEVEKYKTSIKYPIKTNKKYKILANIAQPHLRKNIKGLLKAYGQAFTNEDDVCLVLKISKRRTNAVFEVNFDLLLKEFKQTFKKHAEVKVVDSFIVNIEELYNTCDIVLTMAHAECFWMPGLEGFAANKIVIAPRYGGQLDYMNDNNSILIDGKEIRADLRMQYWEPSPYAKAFEPDITQCVEKLRDVIKNYDDYHQSFTANMQEIVQEYTWKKATQKILDLTQ